MKNYFKIFKKISKRNSKLYLIKNEPFTQILFCKISYLITPFFIIFKFSPNIVTFINFLLSLVSVIFISLGDKNYLLLGIIIYLFYRIIDFCDGSVARYHGRSSFYGRYIDAMGDIFYNGFLIISLGVYCYKVYGSSTILILSSVTAIASTISHFTYDKYAALARWSNSQNRVQVTPYIRKSFFPRLGFIYLDLITACILILPFVKNNENRFIGLICFLFFSFLVVAIQTSLIHLNSAYKNLNIKAEDKTFKKRKRKKSR